MSSPLSNISWNDLIVGQPVIHLRKGYDLTGTIIGLSRNSLVKIGWDDFVVGEYHISLLKDVYMV